jgi:sec-independent protein translocase protein TatC
VATVIGRRGTGNRPERDPEGRMTLTEHLRELRSRLTKALLAVILLGILGVVFYEPILQAFIDPFEKVVEDQNLAGEINFGGIADPFTIPLKLGLMTGLILASPVWIYQIWAFVTPALYRNERRWASAVVLVAVPLFLAGVALCYWLLPRGLAVLLGFTPDGVANIVLFTDYLNFVIRLILVFGIAFLLPVFVLLLNAVGVLSGSALASARRWIVVGVFVFAAVATPTADPITMLMLAMPMWILFELAVLVARFNDRRRRRELAVDDLGDDEATPDDVLDRLGRTDDDT